MRNIFVQLFNRFSPLGLVLEMNVEQNEYLGDLTQDAGIRVQIEDKGKVPFPYEKGFSVGPGSATSVGIRKVRHDKETTLLVYNMYIRNNCILFRYDEIMIVPSSLLLR